MNLWGAYGFFWDNSVQKLEVLSYHEQCITVAVSKGVYVDWVFSAVYAAPYRPVREELWVYLSRMGPLYRYLGSLLGTSTRFWNKGTKRGEDRSLGHRQRVYGAS